MIGLFLGNKKLPLEILKKIKKKKIKYFIIDLTKNNKFKNDKNCYFINIGKFGKILKLIKEKKSKKVLFAGKIDKPKVKVNNPGIPPNFKKTRSPSGHRLRRPHGHQSPGNCPRGYSTCRLERRLRQASRN